MDNCIFDIKDKNVLITGASSGIGKAVAHLLSSFGANIILNGRNAEKLNAVGSVLPSKSYVCPFDLTNTSTIDEFADNVVSQSGKIDGLVHSAGIQLTSSLSALRADDYSRLFHVNFYSFVELTRAFSKRRNYNPGCGFVAISSVAAYRSSHGLSMYSSSKAALNTFIKSASSELIKKKIRINAISPAYVETEMTESIRNLLTESQIGAILKNQPLGFGDPVDVAKAVLFLISSMSTWITGTSLIVNGGMDVI